MAVPGDKLRLEHFKRGNIIKLTGRAAIEIRRSFGSPAFHRRIEASGDRAPQGRRVGKLLKQLDTRINPALGFDGGTQDLNYRWQVARTRRCDHGGDELPELAVAVERFLVVGHAKGRPGYRTRPSIPGVATNNTEQERVQNSVPAQHRFRAHRKPGSKPEGGADH